MSWCIQDKGCSIKIFDLVGEVYVASNLKKKIMSVFTGYMNQQTITV